MRIFLYSIALLLHALPIFSSVVAESSAASEVNARGQIEQLTQRVDELVAEAAQWRKMYECLSARSAVMARSHRIEIAWLAMQKAADQEVIADLMVRNTHLQRDVDHAKMVNEGLFNLVDALDRREQSLTSIPAD